MSRFKSNEIRRATGDDIEGLRAIASDAYALYIPRIGKRPAPMDADFEHHVVEREVYVYELEGRIVGFIVTYAQDSSQFVENIAVASTAQGAGVGHKLMKFADQQAYENEKGLIQLYTNEKMTESFDFYLGLGFVETRRRSEQGFRRIYMEKKLPI